MSLPEPHPHRRVPFLVHTDDPSFAVSAYAPRRLSLAEMQRTAVSAYDTPRKVLARDSAVSAYGASRNPSLQGRGRASEAGTLWTFAVKATQARAAGRQQRRALRFPTLRMVYAKERRDLNGFVTRKAKSYRGDVWRYLTTWGYRTLNDLHGDGYAPPSQADLADLFERRVRERGKTFYPLHSNRGHGISLADAESMADDAAAAVLRDWTPNWIREMRERGATGGRNSPGPGPVWGDHDLDRLAAMDGQTIAQQSIALGVSMSTISRMRRALRERASVSDLDALIAAGVLD